MKNIEKFEKFVISQKGILVRENKALIMRLNADHKLWDLPGGRIDKGENADLAFKREIKEELGISEFVNHGVLKCVLWTISSGVPVGGVINMIESNETDIVLSHEHTEYTWISSDEIENYDFVWPWMKDALREGFSKNK